MERVAATDAFELVDITTSDAHLQALYGLLDQRHAAISHATRPSFQDHVAFVSNHPYRKWMFVAVKDAFVGTVYLHKDNSIGLNLLQDFEAMAAAVLRRILREFDPLPPIKSVRSRHFHINVATGNTGLAAQVAALGATEIQRTYLLDPAQLPKTPAKDKT